MKKTLSLLLALVLCLSLCACGSDIDSTSSDTPTESDVTIENEEVVEDEPTTYKVGDTVSSDIMEVKLISVSYTEEYNDYSFEDGSFVVVKFSLKNIGKNTLSFLTGINGGESKIPAFSLAVDYNDGYTFTLDDIETPSVDISYELFYSPEVFTDELKPLSDAVTYTVAIFVPNEVIDNTEAPLAIRYDLMNSADEVESAYFTIR